MDKVRTHTQWREQRGGIGSIRGRRRGAAVQWQEEAENDALLYTYTVRNSLQLYRNVKITHPICSLQFLGSVMAVLIGYLLYLFVQLKEMAGNKYAYYIIYDL